MQIFMLDPEPSKSVLYLDNVRVSKMITETAQILSSAYQKVTQKNPLLYKMINHPAVNYASASKANFVWLLLYGYYLCLRYEFLFNKQHKSKKIIKYIFTLSASSLEKFNSNKLQYYNCKDAVATDDKQIFLLNKRYLFLKYQTQKRKPKFGVGCILLRKEDLGL